MTPNLPEVCYLFSFFRAPGTGGMFLAWSADGYRWEELNGGRPLLLPEVGREQLMRDPAIAQGPDGVFHMVWTDSWASQTIGYASSPDLIHWSPQRSITVMANEPDVRNCWAPELVYDEEQGHFLIFWSSTIPGRFEETAGSSENDYNHRIHAATTRDFETFTPARLFYDGGFNAIDATLLKDGARWLMFIKDETKFPEIRKYLQWAASEKLEGPYGEISAPFTGSWVEGPSALKAGGEYLVYFDRYIEKCYGAVRSRDLIHWEEVSDKVSFPEGAKHGAALAVRREVLEELLALG